MENIYIICLLKIYTKIKDIVYKSFLKLISTFVLFSLFVETSTAQLIFSEIMQSNVYSVYNHDSGIFPQSWIELYNTADKVDYVRNYSIGNTPDFTKATCIDHSWSVLPMSYVVVRINDDEDCNLDIDGNKLYLFDKTGVIIDSLIYPKMQAPDVSYGIDQETGKYGTFQYPTPGKINSKIVTNGIPSEVMFSKEGGVWETMEPFYLELYANGVPNYHEENLLVDSSLCIRYTLDGSEPNESSLVYFEPIYIDTTKIVKAKVFDSSRPLIMSQVQSYLSLEREVSLPIVSVVTEDSFLFGKERGLLVWEKISKRRVPVNIEIKYGDTLSVNQPALARIQGASSAHETPQRSLAVYAKKRLGVKRIKGSLWKDKPDVDKNKSFILRTGGGNYNGLQICDAWAQRCMGLYSEVDYQAYTPAIAFMNGKYYGRVNIRERSNEDYAYGNYNEEDVEVCKIWNTQLEVTSGDGSLFAQLDTFCETPRTLKEWSEVFDINNMIDSYITYFFFSATDVQNNGLLWRPRDIKGKWRFIIKDLDKVCYHFPDKDYFKWLKGNRISKYLFNALNDKDFLNLFLNRFVAFHGDFLNHDRCMDVLNIMYEEVREETEMFHNPRWGFTTNNDSIISSFSAFLKQKTELSHAYLSEYFQIGKPVVINVNGCENFSYDGIPMHFGSFHGKDFEGRNVDLAVLDTIETSNLVWNVHMMYSNGNNSNYKWVGPNLSFVIPVGMEQIDIDIDIDDNTKCEDVPALSETDDCVYYDQLGRRVSIEQMNRPGIYLKVNGNDATKIIIK